MRRTTLTLSGLIFAILASAQDLPPGVLLLSRVENHIKDELHRLSSLTCRRRASQRSSSEATRWSCR